MDIKHSHLNPEKVPQKDVKSSQKQPGCKKSAALFKMASVKKAVKSKGRPRIGCDGIGWWQNFNNSGEFCADS